MGAIVTAKKIAVDSPRYAWPTIAASA
jgi:hypothetical protein